MANTEHKTPEHSLVGFIEYHADGSWVNRELEKFSDQIEGLIARFHLDNCSRLYDDANNFLAVAEDFQKFWQGEGWRALTEAHTEAHSDSESRVQDVVDVADNVWGQVQEMIGDGMADDGREDEVLQIVEDEILPELEQSLEYLKP